MTAVERQYKDLGGHIGRIAYLADRGNPIAGNLRDTIVLRLKHDRKELAQAQSVLRGYGFPVLAHVPETIEILDNLIQILEPK